MEDSEKNIRVDIGAETKRYLVLSTASCEPLITTNMYNNINFELIFSFRGKNAKKIPWIFLVLNSLIYVAPQSAVKFVHSNHPQPCVVPGVEQKWTSATHK